MGSLMQRDQVEAKKKGYVATAAWGVTGLLVLGGASGILVVPAIAGAGYLTWKWFLYRAKRGMRF